MGVHQAGVAILGPSAHRSPSTKYLLILSPLDLRASPSVEGPQAEIQRYLALDGCKFRSGKVHVSSGESRAFFEFKLKVGELW
jgi:hypothetical protein